jgi:oxygen-independent coproporphyrinogen III oxidase
MSSIYLHVPFCRQACHYCDFHFSTNLRNKAAVVAAMIEEVALRKDFFGSLKTPLQSIYFGGGTPSMLSPDELGALLNVIHKHFSLSPEAEITLEANPDDLSPQLLGIWRSLGVNRLSIGIQSFDEQALKMMNRSHSSAQAQKAVGLAQDAAFENLTIDLIYAIPAPSHSRLQRDLQQALQLQVSHISAYSLTIEPKTAFGNALKKGKMKPIDEDFAAQQFGILCQTLAQAGYEQYEISNFAQHQKYSQHNTAYWQDKPYLGIGAAAHSYDGFNRYANIANNRRYVENLQKGILPIIEEKLSPADRINDYMLTSLRTIWGTDLNKVKQWGYDVGVAQKMLLEKWQQEGLVRIENQVLYLTQAGKLLADEIAMRLFFEQE